MTTALQKKTNLLARSAQYDLCGHCSPAGSGRIRDSEHTWIYPAVLPDGRAVRLLKVLQTNICKNDCSYCAHRSSQDIPRETFSPDELAQLFMDLHHARMAHGLFLSSAIPGNPDHGMARMIATAEILRRRFRFNGYIHLKVLPGACRAAVERSAMYADRISINLEAPGPDVLGRIAKDKDFISAILPQAAWIQQAVEDPLIRAGSHTTQFVVGAGGETDQEILRWTDWLYRRRSLGRAYFSAYQVPDENTPLSARPVPLMREHRLYQADFLLRRYGFSFDELVFEPTADLSLEVDPKQQWALDHPEYFPVEILKAPLELLLRVPGIGPVSVKRICTLRIKGLVHSPEDLRKAGVVMKRTAPYVMLDGKPLQAGRTVAATEQMELPYACL